MLHKISLLSFILFIFSAKSLQAQNLIIHNMANTPVFTTNSFKTVGVGKGGYVYAGTANQGIYKFNGTSWEKMTLFTNHNINDIKTDTSKGIWIAQSGSNGAQATNGGVIYLPDSTFATFTFYSVSAGLPSRNCRAIFIDTAMLNQGNPRIWTANVSQVTASVSTSGAVGLGLNTASPNFNSITAGIETASGLGSIQTIGGDHNEIWAYASSNFGRTQILRYNAVTGGFKGVYDYLNTTVTGFTSNCIIRSIYFDSSGRQWIGLISGGLIIKDTSSWTNFNMAPIVPPGAAISSNAISGGKNGKIYIGTSNGLIIYHGGPVADTNSYERITTVEGLPSNNVLDVCEDAINDRLIIATDNGIVFWKKSPIDAKLIWDYSCPHTAVPPVGVVADGVARLYIRIKQDDTNPNRIKKVFVSIKDTIDRNNTLWGRVRNANIINMYSDEASTGGKSIATRTDPTNLDEFWFWYLSPEDFSRDTLGPYNNLSERADTIKIKVIYENNGRDSTDMVIRIIRPPLMMVHGLASSPSAWDKFRYVKNNNTVQFIQSPLFKHKNALTMRGEAAFDVNANRLLQGDNNSIGALKIKSTLQGNIQKIRDDGYAANQLDYVCHSMGGLILRRAMETDKYFANNISYKYNNYGKGFVHKLITINSPHNSSPIADAVTEFLPQISVPQITLLNDLYHRMPDPTQLGGFMRPDDFHSPISVMRSTNAVKNLQVSTYSGGIDLKMSTIKNHLIVGDVDYNFLTSVGNFAIEMKPVLNLLDFVLDEARDLATGPYKIALTSLYYANNIAKGLGFIEEYSQQMGFPGFLADGDLVVPLKSQTAQQTLSLPNIKRFENSPSNFWDACHLTIVGRSDVGSHVMNLLNTAVDDPLFGENIPANNDPEPFGINNDRGNNTTTIITSYDTTKIKITSPSTPNSVYVDSALTVSLNLKDTVGLVYVKVYFQDTTSVTVSRDSNLEFVFNINPQFLINQRITAVAVYDLANTTERHVDTILMNVENLAVLQAFKIETDTIDVIAGEVFYPAYKVKYNDVWISMPGSSLNVSVTVQDPGVLNYTTQNAFVGLQRGVSSAYFTCQGFKDTVVFNSFLPANSNCVNKTLASGNLRNAAIWSKGFIPDVCDSVVIEAGHNVNTDTTIYIRSLRVSPGATLTLQDSAAMISIGDPDLAKQQLDNYGSIIINKGIVNVNGSILLQAGSSFNMTGGLIIIDGNNGDSSKSISNGSHLFNASATMQSFSFTGGELQIIDPPAGPGSQAINCSFNFGDSSILRFGDGISITATYNVNGFGGDLLPAQIGKMIFDPVTSLHNRIFINLNPLNIRSSLDVRSGIFKQQALLKIGPF